MTAPTEGHVHTGTDAAADHAVGTDTDAAAHEHHDHDHDHEDGHEHGDEHGDEHGHEHGGGSGVLARIGHALRPHSHDHADRTDAALESTADGIRAVRISLIALGVTAVGQAAVVAISGSVALLADTIHNLSDALTALPLWLAFLLVRRPASRRYTYGLGRVEDLAGLFVVLMIATSAVVAGWESLQRLEHPQAIGQLPAVILAGLLGFAGNEAVAVYRIRVGRRIGSAALVADGRHARADGFTSLGVVAGALGVAAGWPQADPVVGLVITLAILVVLVGAVRDVGRRLLDGVDPALVDRAEAALDGAPHVSGVRDLRLRWVGHRLHVEGALLLDGSLDRVAADGVLDAAGAAVRAALPQAERVTLRPAAASG
jgi:cation diffusion facilitator family transporter